MLGGNIVQNFIVSSNGNNQQSLFLDVGAFTNKYCYSSYGADVVYLGGEKTRLSG